MSPICSLCPCCQHCPLLRTQHQRTSAPYLHSCFHSETSAQPHVPPKHTPHLAVVWEMHLPSARHLWARGRAKLIYVCTSPVRTSPPLQGSLLSYLTSSACWHRRRMMQLAQRCRHFALPLPLESSSHLWSLGFTQCFSEKKRTSRQVCI